jgi:hypothetical protein
MAQQDVRCFVGQVMPNKLGVQMPLIHDNVKQGAGSRHMPASASEQPHRHLFAGCRHLPRMRRLGRIGYAFGFYHPHLSGNPLVNQSAHLWHAGMVNRHLDSRVEASLVLSSSLWQSVNNSLHGT